MTKKVRSTKSTPKSKISKPQSLRVLIVEDSEDDVLLIIRELRKGGYNPVHEWVETAAAMKKALQEKQWDIILCDYKLPKFNAPSAIALLKEANIDIPLIVVSGTIGEETAVECMRLGACDYIMKDNLSRLYPAITRELEGTNSRSKRKQAEESLRKSEAQFRSLFENSLMGISAAMPNGHLIHANLAYAQMYGYDNPVEMIAEINNVGQQLYANPKERKEVLRILTKKGFMEPRELEAVKRDGTRFFVLVSAREIRDAGGKLLYYQATHLDITDRKKLEETLVKEREELKLIIDASPIIVFYKDKDGRFIRVNKIFAEALNIREEAFVGKTVFDFYSPQIAQNMTDDDREVFQTRRPKLNIIEQYESASGLRWVQTDKVPIYDKNGMPIALIGFAQDITDRKQAEEALRESEENFHISLDNSPLGVRIATAEGETLYANQAVLDMFGYTTIDELRKTPLKDRYTPESYADFQVRKKKRGRGEFAPSEYEISIVRKNGEIRHLRVFRKEVIWNGAKQFQIIYQDITEHKLAEETLLKSEEKYRNILESIEDGYYEVDLAGNLTFFNNSLCRINGYPREELMGMNNRQYTDEYNAKQIFQAFNEVYRTEKPATGCEYEVIRKDGAKAYIAASISLRKDAAGKKIGFRGIIRDITERKRAEEELWQSEKKYRLTFASTSDVIFMLDSEFKISNITPSIEKILGYKPEELINKSFLDLNLMTPESLERAILNTGRVLSGEDVPNVVYDFITKEGLTRIGEVTGSPIVQGGKIIGISCVARDITERVQAEKALKESEKYFKEITENSSDIIVITDKNGEIKYCSRSIERFSGYKPEELIGRNVLTLIHPDDKKRAVGDFGRAILTTDTAIPNAFRIVHKDGSERYFEGLGKNLLDNPAVAGFIMNVHDSTERRQMEEALRRSEEKYRTILEDMEEGYSEIDLKGNFTFVNDKVVRDLGYTKEELIGTNSRQYRDGKNEEEIYQRYNELYKTGKTIRALGLVYVSKNGFARTYEMTASLIRDEQGKPTGFRDVSRDITERKQAEKELLQSEAKYRSLIENAQEGIYQSLVGYLTLNPALAHMLGYDSPEEVLVTITDIARQLYVNPDDRKKLLELVNEKGSVTDFEAEYYKKDGSRIWVSINMHAVRDDQGRLLYYQGINQDITEKKKIEEERQENIARLRKSLGATINAMAVTVETRDPYTAGHQRRVADLARAIATEMNLTSDQIDGVRMAGMIHDIGKISIPSEILTKPTKLTNLEFNLIKTHPASGYNILKDIEFPWPIARIILEHHERIDGSGYPNGLQGEQILLESRIIAIADVVEAISSHRPYRAAFGIDAALGEITKNRGILYDPDFVDACLRIFREKNYNLAA